MKENQKFATIRTVLKSSLRGKKIKENVSLTTVKADACRVLGISNTTLSAYLYTEGYPVSEIIRKELALFTGVNQEQLFYLLEEKEAA